MRAWKQTRLVSRHANDFTVDYTRRKKAKSSLKSSYFRCTVLNNSCHWPWPCQWPGQCPPWVLPSILKKYPLYKNLSPVSSTCPQRTSLLRLASCRTEFTDDPSLFSAAGEEANQVEGLICAVVFPTYTFDPPGAWKIQNSSNLSPGNPCACIVKTCNLQVDGAGKLAGEFLDL